MAQNQSNSLRSSALTNVSSGYRPLSLNLSGSNPLSKPTSPIPGAGLLSSLGGILKTPSYVNTTSLTGGNPSPKTNPSSSLVVMPKEMSTANVVKGVNYGGTGTTMGYPSNTPSNNNSPSNYAVNTDPTKPINPNQPSVFGQSLQNVYNAQNPQGGTVLPSGDIAAPGSQGTSGGGSGGLNIVQRNGLTGTLNDRGDFIPFNQGSTTDNTSGSPTSAGVYNPDILATLQGGGIQSQLLGKGIESNLKAQELAKNAGLLTQRIAQETGNVMNDPNYSGTVRVGQAGNINTQEGAKLNALAAQQAALTGQGNTFLSGASAVSPVMQFGQLTNPLTGAPINGGQYGSNPQLQAAVSQAVQLVQNGASPNDPQVQSLLSTFGLPGQSLFTQALQQNSNGTYNPTLQGAATNYNIGQATNYAGQASQLSTSINTMKNIAPQAINLLSESGLALTDNPTLNQKVIENWGKNVNPTAYSSYMASMGELENTVSNIVASQTGMTPTGVTSLLDSYNFKYTSPTQLQQILGNIDSMGQSRIQALTQAANQAAGGQNNLYTGNQSGQIQNLNPGSNISTGQAIGGAAVQNADTLMGWLTNIFKGPVGEAGGIGAAVKMFGI